jgi:hypothetical protein
MHILNLVRQHNLKNRIHELPAHESIFISTVFVLLAWLNNYLLLTNSLYNMTGKGVKQIKFFSGFGM